MGEGTKVLHSGNVWARDVLPKTHPMTRKIALFIRMEYILILFNILTVVLKNNSLSLKQYVINAIAIIVVLSSIHTFHSDNAVYRVTSYFFMGGLLHCREERCSPISYGTYEYVILRLDSVSRFNIFGLVLKGDIVDLKTLKHKKCIRFRGWDLDVLDVLIDYINECKMVTNS